MIYSSQRRRGKMLLKASTTQWYWWGTFAFVNKHYIALTYDGQVKVILKKYVEVSLLRYVRRFRQRFGDINLLWPVIWAAVRVIVMIFSVGWRWEKDTHKHTRDIHWWAHKINGMINMNTNVSRAMHSVTLLHKGSLISELDNVKQGLEICTEFLWMEN